MNGKICARIRKGESIMHKISRLYDKAVRKFANNKQFIKYLRKKGVQIGENCVVERNCVFGTEPYLIKIGNNVRITNNVKFITHDGSFWVLRNLNLVSEDSNKIGPIVIGNNVNIGWDCMILPNCHVGNNVIIGAGSIITKDVPNNSVVAGVPAKVICTIDEYCCKNKKVMVETKNMSKNDKKEFLLKKYKEVFY